MLQIAIVPKPHIRNQPKAIEYTEGHPHVDPIINRIGATRQEVTAYGKFHLAQPNLACLPVVELDPPEVCCVALGDPECVAGEGAVGEDGLQFTQHVREHQAQLRQVPPRRRGVVEHLKVGG